MDRTSTCWDASVEPTTGPTGAGLLASCLWHGGWGLDSYVHSKVAGLSPGVVGRPHLRLHRRVLRLHGEVEVTFCAGRCGKPAKPGLKTCGDKYCRALATSRSLAGREKRPTPKRVCPICGVIYVKRPNESTVQWERRIHCGSAACRKAYSEIEIEENEVEQQKPVRASRIDPKWPSDMRPFLNADKVEKFNCVKMPGAEPMLPTSSSSAGWETLSGGHRSKGDEDDEPKRPSYSDTGYPSALPRRAGRSRAPEEGDEKGA